jgi:hypothetical protein
MTQISSKLERLIKNSREILPVKVEQGILVGDVLITSQGSIKNLVQNGEIKYKEIHLNVAAIRIANLLAQRNTGITAENIYRADQEYGRWFVDSQLLRAQYQKAINSQEYDRADMLWARYCESRDRTMIAKNRAQALAVI